MYISFEQMPGTARIWIYQLDRALKSGEIAIMAAALEEFCVRWQVHGQDIPASFRIEHDQFLILAVDESGLSASGCSIDSSVHTLKNLQSRLGINFFDRLMTAFLIDDKITLLPLNDVKEKLRQGVMNGETTTFNNLVATKAELIKQWRIAVKDSWLARYLPKGALA